MKYTAWGDGRGGEWELRPGEDPPHDAEGLRPVKTFEADSWEDACRQYHEWQGWEPYKPVA